MDEITAGEMRAAIRADIARLSAELEELRELLA
jgi:hypothetical protein